MDRGDVIGTTVGRHTLLRVAMVTFSKQLWGVVPCHVWIVATSFTRMVCLIPPGASVRRATRRSRGRRDGLYAGWRARSSYPQARHRLPPATGRWSDRSRERSAPPTQTAVARVGSGQSHDRVHRVRDDRRSCRNLSAVLCERTSPPR